MKAIEPIKSRMINAETTSKSMNNSLTNNRNNSRKAGYNRGTSEAHLPSRKDITDESSNNH